MLAAGKRDDGNPIDDETRAYMIYAYSESGESDGHLIEELYGKTRQARPIRPRVTRIVFYSNAKTAGRKKSATIEGAARG